MSPVISLMSQEAQGFEQPEPGPQLQNLYRAVNYSDDGSPLWLFFYLKNKVLLRVCCCCNYQRKLL